MARRKRDYYDVLGVPRDASESDIKRAFRELARVHHPDVAAANDDGERFREINEAYAVLSERDSRARYDRWGHADDSASGLSAVVDAAQEIINDVFRRRRGKTKGKDVRYTLEISFEEAAFGASKVIAIPTASASASTAPTNRTNAGTGGTGTGSATAKPREVTVVVAPGVKDGTLKTFRGEGEPGKGGGAAGDLVVLIRIADHATFRRDNNDVRSSHTISFAQAALGSVIDVPTLDGPVKMRIPEGTQPGRLFRIRGRGIPQAAGKTAPRGDHLVEVQVEVPTELTTRQRELIEELARTTSTELAPTSGPGSQQRKGLLDRVRSLLDE